MPKRSQYDYKQIKNIAYSEIKKLIDTPILFRQLQYQSMIIFIPGKIDYLPLKKAIDNKNTNWHVIVVSDDMLFEIIKKEKLHAKRTKYNSYIRTDKQDIILGA